MCVSCLKQNMSLNDFNNVNPTITTSEDETNTISSSTTPSEGYTSPSSTFASSTTSSATTNANSTTTSTITNNLSPPIIKMEGKLIFQGEPEMIRKRIPNFPTEDKRFLMPSQAYRPSDPFFDFSSDIANYKKVKRSFSFGGFGLFSHAPSFVGMTSQEIESMFDPVSKKEPSKTSKKQIKEYAQKYKHLENGNSKKLPWYRDPLEYTQPAHLVTCIAFVYLAFRLFPDARRGSTEASTLTRLLYVSSVSAVFGAQFWMTFVSGLALFFSVPRHMFAKVQSVLFPMYFLTVAALMLVAVVTYTQHNPTHLWDNHQLIQGCILVFGFIVNLGIRLYLAPILTKLITIKVAIESETGLGTEVGSNQPGVLSRCPHYMRLYKAFRKLHVFIAIGNMASMAGTSFHLYYLATKLCATSS